MKTPSPKSVRKEGQNVLKVHPNHPCAVFVDSEFKTNAEANKITKIFLNRGTFYLEFVSEVDNVDKYSCTCKVTDEELLIEVDLDRIVKERVAKEKADKEDRMEKEKAEAKNALIAEIEKEMILVEGGTFTMGNPEKNIWGNFKDKYNIPHLVTLSSFKIGKYPVTQSLWEKIMGNNPSYFKGNNLPVEQVCWYDAQDFLRKLNEKTGKNYRLPTEAEWEYAARSDKKSKGYEYSGSNDIDEVAWYGNNSKQTTHPVGQKSPNALGIYDMSGNVWEWCNDWWGEYTKDPQINPKGPKSGSYRVLRGGGWSSYTHSCRVSDRRINAPNNRSYNGGFRLSLDP
ncbi:MAG: formylglycine-generating enzyme family protein [Bacteroidales bacterium]|nr:formylglycine-generating enzyme family protein [Bacteroidales bacterium]